MNDESELGQSNNNDSLSSQSSNYIPTLIALDGDKVKERTNNNNIRIISINDGNFGSIEGTVNATNNVSIAGFSAAGAAAIYQSANAIAKGSTIASVFVIDDGTTHVDRKVYRDAVQTIASSGTSIFFIGQHSDNNNSVLRADAQEYAKTAGIAVVIRNTNTSGHGSGYNQIYTRSFNDNLVGYLNGSGQLINTQDYRFDVFDNKTQSWATYNYDEFQAKVDAGEISIVDSGISQTKDSVFSSINYGAEEIGTELVQSDRQELLTYLNDIRKNLTLEVSVPSYNSTTAIPNSEREAVQQFFKATQRLFQVIEADTKFILSAAISLEDLDKLLSEKAGGLGGSSELGNVITGVTTAIGGFIGLLAMGPAGAVSGALIGNKIGSLIGQFFGLDTSSTGSTTKTSETDENSDSTDN